MSKIDFIDIDPQKDVETLIQKYEEMTNTTLYPAQDARILINIFAYYINLLKCQFNDAANLNLVKYSRSPQLDFLGAMKNCIRLEDEDDNSYIERILLSPEGYTTAGPEAAYIYHAKSADSSITDVSLDCPSDDVKITLGNNEFLIKEKNLIEQDFKITMDDGWEEATIELLRDYSTHETIKVKIPHPYKLILYVLTKDGGASQDIIEKIIATLKPVRPLCDKLIVKSAQIEEFYIKAKIYITKNAVLETVQQRVNEALNSFLDSFKKSLNKEVLRNAIISIVRSVDGVYDIDLITPSVSLTARKNISYIGIIEELSWERVEYEQ